jgi:TRAP-type C4-dicarboxylate transport system substrate-binding protein
MIMNLAKWNSLPPDIQKIIDGLSPWASDLAWTEFVQSDARTERKWRESGHTVIDPTREELRLWLELGLPQAEKWIKKVEASGKQPRAIFDEALRLSEE